MEYGYFDSEVIGFDDATGLPIFDRAQDSDFMAAMFSSIWGSGVYPNPSDNLQVMERDDDLFGVKVMPGRCWIQGRFGKESETVNFEFSAASASADRIDNIVVELNKQNREITIMKVEGAAAATPVPPELVRTSDIYQICLAQCKVRKNATKINQSDITDTRMNTALCGYVTGVITQVDTTTIFNQYTAWLSETQKSWGDWSDAEKEAWYEWWKSQEDTSAYVTTGSEYQSLKTANKKVLDAINEVWTTRPGENLLINGTFSLWDRGTTWNSPPSGTYTANRWRSSSVVCKKVSPISNGGIRVEGAPQHHNMAQLVEWQHFELSETERVTLSVMLKFDNPGVEFLIGRGGRQGTPEDPTGVYKSFISTGELQKVSFTFDAAPITGNDAKPWWISPVRIGAVTTPQSYEIYSAKLELGEIATPHFPRSRSVERTMASRYCAPMFGGYGWVSAAGRADIMYPIQSAFRVKPTVILPSGESVRVRGYNGMVGQSSNVTVSNSYTTQILVAINGIATNVPVGTAFAYMTAGTLILDAEIY